VLEAARRRLAAWIAPKKPTALAARMYAAAESSRLTAGWLAPTSTADAELATSLGQLRARSRQLVRDASYAKRAKTIVVNNVIGSGVGLQAQVMTTRGALNESVNDAIEAAFAEWSRPEACHTGGALWFSDLERLAMGQVFEAGEILIREHLRGFGDSAVPYALEVIEPERIADDSQIASIAPGAMLRLGVEVDTFGRPVAYWIRERNPGDLNAWARAGYERIERVPAAQIIHLRIVNRWPQTRGEPWLHAVARRLNDMDGYSQSEIVAARGAASYVATIETTADLADPTTATAAQTPPTLELSPGLAMKLDPGEKLNFVTPNRPNTAMDPFMRLMLREVAAGADVSYESLSRDYSQSNYSSSRLALLDDRDLWKQLQQWWIRNFRMRVHRTWLRQAVLARAIGAIRLEEYVADPRKFEAVRFKPRGWSWIDPTKEVEAYKQAVRCGFKTVSDVVAETGNGVDLEDVLRERRRERDMMEEADLAFDTDVLAAATPGAAPPDASAADPAAAADAAAQDAAAARAVFRFRRK
jgi:lambda family phage portal protein